jgi:hypothetical protein
VATEGGKHLCTRFVGHFERDAGDEPEGGKEGEGSKRCEHEHFPIVLRPTRNRCLSSGMDQQTFVLQRCSLCVPHLSSKNVAGLFSIVAAQAEALERQG